MTQLNIPYTFQNQTTSDANQVDQNFNAVANVMNGKLADDNMTPNSLTSASVATEGIVATDTKNLVYAQDLFSSSFIISGGVCTKDGTNASQVDVTSPILGWVKQSDNTFRRLSVSVTNYKTTIANTTYYLDLGADGTVYWAQNHPSVNYTTIVTVTSDASANVNVITDTRNLLSIVLSNFLRIDANAPNPQAVTNPVAFGIGTGGTDNGQLVIVPADRYPSFQAKRNGTTTNQIMVDVQSGLIYLDGAIYFRGAPNGTQTFTVDTSGNGTFAGNVSAPNISSPASGTWTPASGTFNVAVGTVINAASAPSGAKMFFTKNTTAVTTDVADSWGVTTSSGTAWKCSEDATGSVSTGHSNGLSTTSYGGTLVKIGDSTYTATGYFQVNGGYLQFVVVTSVAGAYSSTIWWAVS